MRNIAVMVLFLIRDIFRDRQHILFLYDNSDRLINIYLRDLEFLLSSNIFVTKPSFLIGISQIQMSWRNSWLIQIFLILLFPHVITLLDSSSRMRIIYIFLSTIVISYQKKTISERYSFSFNRILKSYEIQISWSSYHIFWINISRILRSKKMMINKPIRNEIQEIERSPVHRKVSWNYHHESIHVVSDFDYFH